MNRTTVLACAFLILAPGCGDRPQIWSQSPSGVQAFGLASTVVLLDPPARRAVALSVAGDSQNLTTTPIRLRHDIVATASEPDGSKMYVLTAGHRAQLGDPQPDEAPALTVIEDGKNGAPPSAREIDLGAVLSDPLSGLAVDPEGRWIVLSAGTAPSDALVANPNELVIIDLAQSPPTLVAVTLHSFGGRPERLIFSPALGLPGGQAHLLIVQSQQDLALLQLEKPRTEEITVRLGDATTVNQPRPAQVVVDDGDPARNDDARIGIRFDNDSSVITLQLGPAPGPNGYAPTLNVADVGGIPSDIAFVRTDGGLRLAALVPAGNRAVLVDTVTAITTDVPLPAPYRRLSLVTGAAASADTALLWAGSGPGGGVAFWELGQTAGRPFRSIETVSVAVVGNVLDVPPPHAALKVLQASSENAFYVLDLDMRTAAPLVTSSPNVALAVSPSGQRVWTFVPRGTAVASTDLASKHARTLLADKPISAVFEIAHSDGRGRTLMAIHDGGNLGVTLFDADKQDDRNRRLYGALLTEGPYEDD
jgi:hypothetical protein